MLIAIYRANEDAFIRGNINLVRSGRILNIPAADAIGTVDRAEAEKLVRSHSDQWNDYRGKLAAVPARAEGGTPQREVTGRITDKPAAPPAAQKDELRLSKVDPQKPAAGAAGRAAREDDAAARERALKEAQSRQADLEKNVADLQKLLALKNQQLAELEKKGAAPAKPAPEAAKPAPEAAKPAPEAAKPAAKAPEAPKPAPEAPKSAAAPTPPPAPAAKAPETKAPEGKAPEGKAPEAPKPEAAKPAAPAPKPPADAAKAPPPKPKAKAPEPGLLDEVLENPMMAFGGLALIVLLLGGYGYVAWRRKKQAHAKFQDSVLGAAAAGASSGSALAEPTTGGPNDPAAATEPSASQAATPAGMDSEEVDPIAEADVYMAYGRDAQAEEILKEALSKEPNRSAVHGKLLEIYANRKDKASFEQTALKLKGITNGAGTEWDKAAALGRSIDPQNGLYAGAGEAPEPAPAAAASPTIDFDLGGGPAPTASAPDISLDEPAKEGSAPLDFDLGGAAPAAAAAEPAKDFTADETVLSLDTKKEAEPGLGGLDFNLDLGADEKKTEAPAPASAPAAAPASDSGGLDFDLNLDLGGDKPTDEKPAAAMDLSSISLDLGGDDPEKTTVVPTMASTDPKWQEVATKLDLAKAYEEMGDKDGAKELLGEVMKDGDAAQKGQAQQLLAKLG